MRGDGRTIADFDRRIRLLARAYAFDEVYVMIIAFRIALNRFAVGAIRLLRGIAPTRLRLAADHVGRPCQPFNRAVRTENANSESKAAVAESRLPRNDHVVWIIKHER